MRGPFVRRAFLVFFKTRANRGQEHLGGTALAISIFSREGLRGAPEVPIDFLSPLHMGWPTSLLVMVAAVLRRVLRQTWALAEPSARDGASEFLFLGSVQGRPPPLGDVLHHCRSYPSLEDDISGQCVFHLTSAVELLRQNNVIDTQITYISLPCS